MIAQRSVGVGVRYRLGAAAIGIQYSNIGSGQIGDPIAIHVALCCRRQPVIAGCCNRLVQQGAIRIEIRNRMDGAAVTLGGKAVRRVIGAVAIVVRVDRNCLAIGAGRLDRFRQERAIGTFIGNSPHLAVIGIDDSDIGDRAFERAIASDVDLGGLR